jgi:glutamate-1-semialdehyde 2,1-aminomutase
MSAGLAVLNVIAADERLYDRLEASTRQLVDGLGEVMRRHGVPHQINRAGAMFSIFFTPDPVADLETARKSDRALFAKYFGAMLERGIYLAPSPFETNFLSAAHGQRDLDRTIGAAEGSWAALLATA